MRRFWVFFAIGAVIGGLAVYGLLGRGKGVPSQTDPEVSTSPATVGPKSRKPAPVRKETASVSEREDVRGKAGRAVSVPQPDDEPVPDETDAVLQAVEAWEKLVDEVLKEDNTEPLAKRGERIQRAIAKLPESERQVGVQGLLNLLPDESFAMLEPILLDPKEDPEVLDVIFSDMLNRPESVKNGYILAISKMRDHPQFTDAMHIKTVTEMERED